MLIADVRVFLAVASAGNLSSAARSLNVTPMQVSRRLAALEHELGVRLLHRTTRSVALTDEGEAFLPYAASIADTEDSALAELSPTPTRASGTLRFTAPSVFGRTVVLAVLPELLREHPELRLDMDLSDRQIDIVGQGFDLALRIAPMGDSDLVAHRLASNPRIICASPEYLARRGKPRTVAELDEHDCVLLHAVPRWPLVVDGALRRRRMNGRVNTSSVDAVRSAATQGLGLAMLTYWDVHAQLTDGTLERVELEDAGMEDLSVWAVMPTRRFVPGRVRAFLSILQKKLCSASKGRK